jgi:hypothetical protein
MANRLLGENPMSRLRSVPFRGSLFLATALCFTLVASGCGDDSGVGKTFPVSGKITLDDSPLTAPSTIILFKPDSAKGNTSPFEPTGTVDSQGNYTLATKGKNGAPPGWYKVIVTATEFHPDESKGPRRHHPTPKSLVPARYGQAATTVSIEVVESPAAGAYYLKLTRK